MRKSKTWIYLIRLYVFVIIVFCLSNSLFSQSDTLSILLQKGKIEKLSTYFKKQIDIHIPSNEGMYTPLQAGSILKDFFNKHPIKSFEIKHSGESKTNSVYIIGTLSVEDEVYRTYILYRVINGKMLISEFRLDSEE